MPSGPFRIRAAKVAAIVVVLASTFAGGLAIERDLRATFRDAGPSVFTPVDRAQMNVVRRAVPAGETLLLFGRAPEVWRARLWQRALYPRLAVVERFEPWQPSEIRSLRDKYSIRYAVSMGDPPPDPGFRSHEDLGPLAGQPGRVWFGELLP